MQQRLRLLLSLCCLLWVLPGAVRAADDNTVKLIHAEGMIFYNEIIITWSTEYEKAPCDFIIEASADQKDWRIRGRMRSQGSPTEHAEYKFVDTRDDKMLYYRIRKVDATNTVLSTFTPDNYSIKVNLDAFTIHQEKRLVLEYTIDQGQELIVRIYNRIGEQVVTKVLPTTEAGEYIFHFDVSDLPPDNYLLVINQAMLDKTVAEKPFVLK